MSSTFDDLREERQVVMQALLELDCIPSGMELFPAADEEQWGFIQRTIDDCDYYVLILAGRYGSLGPDGRSYTQMEYEYALEKNKPSIAFLHIDPGRLPADRTERNETARAKLDSFRDLTRRRLCKLWSSPAELGAIVSRGITQLKKNRPAIGWIRANLAGDETASQEIVRLRRKIEELDKKLSDLDAASAEALANLAQADEYLEVHVFGDMARERADLTLTWREAFAAVLSRILVPAPEFQMRAGLSDLLSRKYPQLGFERLHVSLADLDSIKIQLCSLGLAEPKPEPDIYGGSDPYWRITPKGLAGLPTFAATKSTLQDPVSHEPRRS